MAETEPNEPMRAPPFPTMSDTTVDVLIEELEDAQPAAGMHENVRRAVKVKAEIVKNKRDLDQIVSPISELAVEEPELCKELLNVCLAQMGSEMEDNEDFISDFHCAFIARVERIVRSKNMDNLVKEKEASIDAEIDEKKKEGMLHELDEMRRNFRTRKIELATFVGRLFLTHLIYSEYLLGYVTDLTESLSSGDGKSIVDEHSLECAVLLLSMVGKKLDGMLSAEDSIWTEEETLERRSLLDAAFSSIAAAQPLVSEQIRIMIGDLVELRANGWAPGEIVDEGEEETEAEECASVPRKTVDEGEEKIETEEVESVPMETVDEGEEKIDEIEGETEEEIEQFGVAEDTSMVSRLEDDKRKLKMELDLWKKSHQIAVVRVKEKDEEIRKLDEECIELEEKLSDQIEKNSVLSKKSATQAKDIDRLDKDWRAMYEELQSRCQNLTNQVTAVERETHQSDLYKRVYEKLLLREEENSILSEKSADQTMKIRQLASDRVELWEKLDQSEKKCQELLDREVRNSEAYTMYERYLDVHRKWKDQEGKNSVLSKKSANQTAEICRLENSRSELRNELETLLASKQSMSLAPGLTEKVALLEEQRANMEQKWRASEEDRKRMEDEAIRADEERKKALTELNAIRAELAKTRDDKEAFRNDYRCYKQHYEAHLVQLKEADKELDQWKDKYQQLQSNQDNEKDRKIRMLDKKFNEMKKKLDDQIEKNSVLSKKLTDETSKVSQLEDDKRKSTTILNKTDVVMLLLKKSHQAQVDHAKEKEKEIQMLNESKKKLEGQNSVLSKKLANETSRASQLQQISYQQCFPHGVQMLQAQYQPVQNSSMYAPVCNHQLYHPIQQMLPPSPVYAHMNHPEVEKDKKIQTLNESKKKLEDQISVLSKKLADETSKANRLEDEKMTWKSELSERDLAVDKWKKNRQTWVDYAGKKEKECIELNKKLDDQIEKNSDLSKKLDDEISRVKRYKDEKGKLTTKLSESDAIYQSWVDYANAKDDECIELEEKLKELEEKNSVLSKKSVNHVSEIHRLENSRKEMKEKLDKRKKSRQSGEIMDWAAISQNWSMLDNKYAKLEKKLDDQTAPKKSIWSEHTHTDGRVFYYNKETRQSVWEKPDELKTTAKPRRK